MGKRLALLLLASMSGCTCGRSSSSSSDQTTAPSPSDSVAIAQAADGGATDARFSAPIDAVHSAEGSVFVAGLVVPAHAIQVTKIGPDGKSIWTHTAFDDVAWSPDAALDVRALGAGLVVTWEGPRGGHKSGGRLAQLIDGEGAKHGDPFPVGGPVCTTKTEVAWPESGTLGTRVLARTWDGTTREVAHLAADREPSIVCSRSTVFAVGEGDDDVSLVTSAPPRTLTLLGGGDFPGDEERDHQMYGFGARLGLVRIGASGAVALRDIQDSLGPWRATTFHMREEDNLETVDGDARATYLVTTHDEESPNCGAAAAASSVHVQMIANSTAGTDAGAGAAPVDARDIPLASAECEHERGPFWTDALGGDMVVAWAVRASRTDKTTPPIASLDFRTIGPEGVRKQGSLPANADSLVDAGCDGTHCYAVTLARAPGTDMMLPESARILLYP